ncbi:MAG: hypothetical protein A3J73_07280 [Planctomycetes bacterium RIFCSPHIGHO2_02_FULL_38_41]|nr:MAG: hypothetical protein A3J73_07280 [Planctomycetes bacterium RIFCSPHIGHO2_02_FULL_38_41]OHB92564.1 MAG: hypothetical protein A2Z57_00140 [Planctomycetes bacterium RIFCSPHIGHO2_12_39_6]OHB97379.1 MAG: hypothetical protein A2W74_06135 [Planctomycetes bacterium RIFCSPLOWO2_12_38_17]
MNPKSIEESVRMVRDLTSSAKPPIIEVAGMPGVELTREETRKYIAYGALGGFLGILGLIIIFGWLICKHPIDDVIKVLTTTAGVLSGVVGAIVGFYFRGENR